MKKMMFVVFLVVGLVSVVAMADLILPNQVVIYGADAAKLSKKIVEITGQTPKAFRNRAIVQTTANVSCSEIENTPNTATCSVFIPEKKR